LKVTGPVYCDSNQFFHQGEMQDNVDFSFPGGVRARRASADGGYDG
jgi:hypothetical protein